MEDRMLSDEILLGIINAKSGGGGGGTSNYNDLSNKPQIGGTTLSGNKTASDLGLVAAENGKGLSSNDYTDADKAIVGGVTAALAGKQDALTAGKYINIDANNEISVDPVVPNEAFTYTIQQIGDGIVKITKTVSGAVVFEKTYNGNADITLDALHYVYSNGVQSYTLLIASDTHEAGFKQSMSWWARDTFTENFSTVDHSGEKLIIKSEMDDALALKQDKTDNSLQTTDKTVVGAVNELKSGLTNVQDDVKLNTNDLTTPSRTKNLLPMTLSGIKSANTTGTWSGNAYTVNDVTFTVQTDDNGNVTEVTANGTAPSEDIYFVLGNISFVKDVSYRMTSGTTGSTAETYRLWAYSSTAFPVGHRLSTDSNCGENVARDALANEICSITFMIMSGYAPDNVTVYPMVRLATETDATFAPYIPSVESRIEAVESGTANLATSDLLYDGYPTSVDTFEQKDLVSGKNLSNYLFINVVCKHYENTRVTVIEPIHVFTTQNADSKRIVMKDADVNSTEVYYVSPTKIAVKQHVVDNGSFHTAVYGVLKKS